MNARRWIVAATLCVVFAVGGCGARRSVPPGSKVSGTVTTGGAPAPGAIVKFLDDKGQTVGAGTAGDDGSYVAANVPRKALKVIVEETPTTGPYAWTPPPPGTTPVGGGLTVKPAKIPTKYQKAETSGLTATLSKDEEKLDLPLE